MRVLILKLRSGQQNLLYKCIYQMEIFYTIHILLYF